LPHQVTAANLAARLSYLKWYCRAIAAWIANACHVPNWIRQVHHRKYVVHALHVIVATIPILVRSRT
jgi:hypothetical protein